MKVSEILEKALNRLGANGENWIQGWFHGPGERACSVGAINDVVRLRLEDSPAMIAAIGTLKRAVGYTGYLFGSDWNDDPKRTWAEIQNGFLKAIALARQEESLDE